MLGVLWTVFLIIVALWLLGFIFNVVGGAIHLLLIIAAVVLIYNLFFANRNRISS